MVVTGHERFRRPTGINTFPDGGRSLVLERSAAFFLVRADDRSWMGLARISPSDTLWESFSATVHGLDGDSVAYLRASGCPKGGECHPALSETRFFRLTLDGTLEAVGAPPPRAELPGVMLARAPDERNYVRFSTRGRAVTARFEPDVEFTPIYEVLDDGSLAAIFP